MKINGKEIEFDATDSIQIAKMEEALENMGSKEAEIKSLDAKLSVQLVRLVGVLSDFFKEATGEDILEGVTSYEKAQQFYFDFLNEIGKQKSKVLAAYNPNRVR